MAVTSTAADLRLALGLADDAAGNVTATRLLAVASALVTRYAPDAPDAIANEGAIRTAGYLSADSPELRTLRKLTVGDGLDIEPRAVGSALRLSGAAALLSSWRVRRAVRVTT